MTPDSPETDDDAILAAFFEAARAQDAQSGAAQSVGTRLGKLQPGEVHADAPPDLPEGLMARIIADADREMRLRAPMPDPIAATGAALPAPRWWVRPSDLVAALFEGLGGWPATAGLAVTAMAGIWIGYSPPMALDGWIGGTDLSDVYSTPAALLAGYDAFLADG